LSFSQLWLFVEAYRRREGFSKEDTEELRECFSNLCDGSDIDDGQLDAFNVGHIFVQLGLGVSCTQVQRFVANVDIDGSGTIDFPEFLKIARQLCQHTSKKAAESYISHMNGLGSGEAVQSMLEDIVPVAYHADTIAVLREDQKEIAHLDNYDFVRCVHHLRKLTRKNVQNNYGFGEQETAKLREHFAAHDRQKTGILDDSAVQHLLETLFMELATSASKRPQLLEIMRETTSHTGGKVNFAAFMKLMRKVKDLSELDRLRRERDAIELVSFSGHEVNELRELFLGSKDREFLTLLEVQEILSVLIPMGAKNIEALTKVFEEVQCDAHHDSHEQADFSEFLLLLDHMMKSDVADINERAKNVACAAAHHDHHGCEPPSPDNGGPQLFLRRASTFNHRLPACFPEF